ncbi:MAG: hypothetical protein PHH37_06505 [Paludibacter sp.]|nr:hypothetical protein [Paludibacter sp.]
MKKQLRILLGCLSIGVLFTSTTLANQPIDYAKMVKLYADEMLRNGQDHYGKQSSPLFSTALLRESKPTLLPYPQFQRRKEKSNPGNRWVFETYFLNIPMLGSPKNGSRENGDHGMEKPHKQTISGDDPLDNLGVYKAFFLLSDYTGIKKYKKEATKSLKWFYEHTQGPSGLYPWGEHMGWDFRHDYVTYHIKGHEDFILNPYKGNSAEPITELYQSWEHEPRGMYTEWEPFLEILADLPAGKDEFYKPIEKYSLGIWEQHFFDKDNGFYNRHGDYFGLKRSIEGTYGSDMMFPKYTGYFMETWSVAYQHSDNPQFKSQISEYIRKLIKGNKIIRNKFGFRASLITGGEYDTRQCLQMAYQAIKSGKRIEKENTELGMEMISFGKSEIDFFCNYIGNDIDKYKSGDPETLYYAYLATEDNRLLEMYYKIIAGIISDGDKMMYYNAGEAAKCIESMLNMYQLSGDKKYLKEAGKRGEQAVNLYFTKDSCLPKCVPANYITCVDNKIWRTFYYAHLGSDDLMAALMKLSIALKNP